MNASTAVVESPRRRSSVAAGVVGNFVEFYDWTIYAYMAPVFAAQFFPSDNPAVSLLLTFSVFSLGYIARPVGALLFGAYSDRLGRRNAMSVAIVGMALCSLIIAVCPTYAAIGIAAPVLLVLARLMQGISAGGEGGSATTYLVEFARPGRRALGGSWQQISTGFSTLCALGVSRLMGTYFSPSALAAWGWRVPFYLGAALGVFGLYLRLHADETPVFTADVKTVVERKPLLPSLVAAWRTILLVSAIATLPTIAFLTWQIYLPTYLTTTTTLDRNEALTVSILGVVFFLCLLPVSALLADRVGRRPMMIAASLGAIVWSYPTFVGLPTFANSLGGAIVITLIGNVIIAGLAGSLVACMVEQFDTAVRATGNGLAYAFSNVISGATFPPLVTALAGRGQYSLCALFVVGMAVFSLAAYWMMPETRDKPLSQRLAV